MAKTKLFPRRNASAVRRPAGAPLATPPAPEAAIPPKPSPEPEPSTDRAASGKVIDRIGVPIDASGAFDLDSMRPATRSRFDAAMKKTKFASPTNADAEYRPIAVMAVDAVISLQVMAATLLKVQPHEARHLSWNSAQRSVLADQLAAVLARHPQWMQNAPEALLGATYCGFLVASLQAIRSEREQRSAPAPTNISEPPSMEVVQ